MDIDSTVDANLEHRRLRSSVREALFGHRDPVRIGRFTVLRRVGAGGMGVVYSAYDDELDRKLAIKLVREDRATGPASRDRLRREAQAAAKLDHPNVVSVFEVGAHEGRLYIAMEFVHGTTLREWLAERPHTFAEVRDVFVHAGEGLAAAHEAGLVHRDFKPDNVMVASTPSGTRVKVLDFGLAAIAPEAAVPIDIEDRGDDTASDRLTVTGQLLGTPAYMAPEQHAGIDVDARADQYAFCLSLWEALHRARPFATGDGRVDIEAMQANRLPAPSERRVPARVQAILARGLEADPTRRFASMRELLTALRRDPARYSRRVALMVTASVLVAAATAFGFWQAERTSCVPAKERIASVWGPARQAEIRRAVGDADPDLPLRAWGDVVARVNDQLARWTTVYEQTCDAIAAAGDEEPLLRRRLCLEASFDELERVLATLATGDVSAMDERLRALAPPEACADEAEARELAARDALRHLPPPDGLAPGTVVADFEDGMRARIGVGWQWSTDTLAGGKSSVELDVVDDADGHALRITGEVRPNATGPQWSGAIWFPGTGPMSPVNFSELEAVTFRARGGPGQYYVLLFTQRSLFDPASVLIDVGQEWKAYRIRLDEFESERFDVTGLFFGNADDVGSFELFVDDVAFE